MNEKQVSNLILMNLILHNFSEKNSKTGNVMFKRRPGKLVGNTGNIQ